MIKKYFMLIDQQKNVLLVEPEKVKEFVYHGHMEDVKQHSTQKELFDFIRNYLKGVYDEQE